MSRKRVAQETGLHIPQSNGAILTRTRQRLSICTPTHASDSVGVSNEHFEGFAGGAIPQPNGAIQVPPRQRLSICTPTDARHSVGADNDFFQGFAGLHIPLPNQVGLVHLPTRFCLTCCTH